MEKKQTATNVIEIEALQFWSDWTDIIKRKIDLDKTVGFRLHFRIDMWRVEVVTKDLSFTSELNHGVWPLQIARIMADSRCNVLSIDHNNSDGVKFTEQLQIIAKQVESILKPYNQSNP